MESFIAEQDKKLIKFCLSCAEDISYSEIMKLLREKDIKVNGKRVNKDCDLKAGDKVEIYRKPKKERDKRYSVLYEDENVLVLDKKSGVTSEELFKNLSSEKELKFIHRLDRNTKGVMIFALNEVAEKELLRGFKKRTFDKTYRALVFGEMPNKEDVLTAYLKKDAEKNRVFVSNKKEDGAVEIKTGYKVINIYKGFSETEIKLYTGKTHQIRAHMAYIGNAVMGDGKYARNADNKKFNVKRQQLIAYKLTLHFEKNSPLYYLDDKAFTSEEKFDFTGEDYAAGRV